MSKILSFDVTCDELGCVVYDTEEQILTDIRTIVFDKKLPLKKNLKYIYDELNELKSKYNFDVVLINDHKNVSYKWKKYFHKILGVIDLVFFDIRFNNVSTSHVNKVLGFKKSEKVIKNILTTVFFGFSQDFDSDFCFSNEIEIDAGSLLASYLVDVGIIETI